MIILSIILGVIILIMGYIIRNLLLKNEKQEDILTGYMVYLNKISKIIETSDKKMKEIDAKGSFKSDDEVGFFFQQIYNIQTILNSFIIDDIKCFRTISKSKHCGAISNTSNLTNTNSRLSGIGNNFY